MPSRSRKILTGAKSSVCPDSAGRQQFLVGGLQPQDQAPLHPRARRLRQRSRRDQTRHVRGKFDGGGYADDRAASPAGSWRSIPRPARSSSARTCPTRTTSGALATAGGIVVTALLDGTIMALDDQTLEELWTINVGTGINAPPMTYAVDGKQYIAIATGLTRNQVGKLANAPEMKNLAKNATMIFVFGL